MGIIDRLLGKKNMKEAVASSEAMTTEALGKLVMELDQGGGDPERSLIIACAGCGKQLGLFFGLGDVFIKQDATSIRVTNDSGSFKCSRCGNNGLKVSRNIRRMSERLREDIQSLASAPFDVSKGFIDEDVKGLYASAHDCRFLDFGDNVDLLVRAVSGWLQWSGYNASGTITAVESCTRGPIAIPKCPVIWCYSQRLGEVVWIVRNQDGSLWVCDPNVPNETAMLERWRVLLAAADGRR